MSEDSTFGVFSKDYIARNHIQDCVQPSQRINYKRLNRLYFNDELFEKLGIKKKNGFSYEEMKKILEHLKK